METRLNCRNDPKREEGEEETTSAGNVTALSQLGWADIGSACVFSASSYPTEWTGRSTGRAILLAALDALLTSDEAGMLISSIS